MRQPITVIAVDTNPESHSLARFAVSQTLLGLDVQEVVFFGGAPLGLGERFVEIQHLGSIGKYSEFILKCLWPFVATDFVLVVQWDGFVANPASWRDDFLSYDFIGAPWAWTKDQHRVGNGGFSLRSMRLIEACRDVKVRRHPEIRFGGHEDIVIGRLYRSYLEERGIAFAPVEVAEAFSYEQGPLDRQPFGFHAAPNIPLFVPEKPLLELAPALRTKIKPGPVLDLFRWNCEIRGYRDLLALMAGT